MSLRAIRRIAWQSQAFQLPWSYCAIEFGDGGQLELSEFYLGAFGLDGDLTFGCGAVGAVIDEIAVNPDLDLVIETFDDHRIPLARGLF